MRSAISGIALVLGAVIATSPASAQSFEEILRRAARASGFSRTADLYSLPREPLVEPGRILFESSAVSLNDKVSCRDCHLDEFSSGDGIPNAVGIGGIGRGRERVQSGGGVIPRNTLPLWGRGGRGFDVLFWDGKVDFSGNERLSQFGDDVPSNDPLVTAVHLPPVEIREMVIEDEFVGSHKKENAEGAKHVYSAIAERIRSSEPAAVQSIAEYFSVEFDSVDFLHMARAIAEFIRFEFRIRPTRFHQFVFEEKPLSDEELAGGLIFYGKGKCAVCHSGPYLSDLSFHTIAYPQLGFGKNGFGVDYGRYNATHDPADLYKFRTPPLFNVAHTGPYGHSGSVATLEAAVIFHFDPFRALDPARMSAFDRTEYYKVLSSASDDLLQIGFLDEREVKSLVHFLEALSF